MRTTLIALLFLALSSFNSYSMDRSRMKIVQTMIDSAKTQADLNIASKMLFDIWQEELKSKEAGVARMLPKAQSKRFRQSMRSWRRHVEEMSNIRAELFKQDFMEPKYYKIRGIESKVSALKRAKNMHPYIYNMSRSIYYEEKWIELDVLVNTK